MFAELAIQQAPVRQTFHYAIPDGMDISIGQLVEVSFRTGRSQGIVLDLSETSPVVRIKPILDVISAEPVVTPTQIGLARWMSNQTITPISACLWLMLPPGLTKRGDTQYTLLQPDMQSENETAQRIIELLIERGPLRGAQIDHALPRSKWRVALEPLIRQGLVRREAVLAAPDVKVRTVRTVQIAIAPDEVETAIITLKLKSQKQIAVLRILAEQTDPVDTGWLADQTDTDSAVWNVLEKKGLITIGKAERWRDPLAGRYFATSTPPPLTPQQAACWQIIESHLEALADPIGTERPTTYLLHGVTGSGKTEIYLRAIERVLAQGRQAIVLVPEIALVPQTVQRFASRFPDRVNVVHSSLSDGEQYDNWRRTRAGEIDIVVGARSALFTPLPDVGLVVIDEEHDDSYKQSPPLPPPYYHAREAAIAMMGINRGTVILGSATPDLNTAFRAHRGEIKLIEMPNRVMVHREQLAMQAQALPIPSQRFTESGAAQGMMAAALPPVHVVDMRQELRGGNRSMFSHQLRVALNEVLGLGEQAMLFLNRRGTASFILCRDCGYIAKCPNCESPLTYHHKNDKLVCHSCNFKQNPPEICPSCQSKRIRYFGAGTAQVEEAVKQEFPQARPIRWDRDTTQERGAHEGILQEFAHGDANVLIGTQMIAKGLDIPRVTLVGVILADTALGLPDYRSGERTFQLLTQVAGRAGRSWLGGRVVLQTYQPNHYAIVAASHHDYEAFYQQEIEYRRVLQYPPYKRLVRLQFRYPNPVQAQQEAERAAEMLQRRIKEEQLTATELIGPAPAFFGKVDNVYHWHIIAKTTDPHALLGDISAKSGWYIDIDPVDIL
jgi:primosomal protein N' (replication factor Y) (superfamily II helicase)